MAVQLMWDLLDEMVVVQVFLPIFQFSIVNVTPPELHNHLYVGHLESKERLRIQPAQLFHFS